jgi:hypothetical protein
MSLVNSATALGWALVSSHTCGIWGMAVLISEVFNWILLAVNTNLLHVHRIWSATVDWRNKCANMAAGFRSSKCWCFCSWPVYSWFWTTVSAFWFCTVSSWFLTTVFWFCTVSSWFLTTVFWFCTVSYWFRTTVSAFWFCTVSSWFLTTVSDSVLYPLDS